MLGLNKIGDYLTHPGTKNTGAIAIAKGAMMAVRTVFLLWVARKSGPDIFGRLALCVTTAEMLRIAADFGTQTLFVRRFAQAIDTKECARHLVAMCRFRIVATAGGVLLYFAIVAATFPGKLHELDVLPVGLLVTALSSSLPFTFYQAKLEMNKAMAPVLACGALFLVYSLLFGRESVLAETCGLVGYEAVAAIILTIAVFRQIDVKFRALRHGDPSESVGAIARECLPIVSGALISTVYTRVDVFAVKVVAGPVALGLYSYAFRLTEPFRYLALAIESSLYSHLSSKLSRNSSRPPRFQLMMRLVLAYALGFSLVAYGGAILVTWRALPEYGAATTTILALCCALFLRCVNGYLTAVQNALGRYRLTANFSVVSFFVTIVMVYPLTRAYGFLGAALTLLIMETLNFLLQEYFYRRAVIAVRRGYA